MAKPKRRKIRVWLKKDWIAQKEAWYQANLAIAGALKAMRTRAQVPQRLLASSMGYSLNTIGKMESGSRYWYPEDVEQFRKAVEHHHLPTDWD